MSKKNIPEDAPDVFAKTQSLEIVNQELSLNNQNIQATKSQFVDFSKFSINPFSILLESKVKLNSIEKIENNLKEKQNYFENQKLSEDETSQSLKNKQIITMINQALQYIKTKE